MLANFSCFLTSAIFFFKLTLSENSFKNTIRMSNSHDLGPKFLQRLKSPLARKKLMSIRSDVDVSESMSKYGNHYTRPSLQINKIFAHKFVNIL